MPMKSTIKEAYLYFRQFWNEEDCEVFAYTIDTAQRDYDESRTNEVFDVWFEKRYTLKPHEIYHRLEYELQQRGEFYQKVWDIVGDGRPYDYPAQILRYVEDLKREALKPMSEPTGNTASTEGE